LIGSLLLFGEISHAQTQPKLQFAVKLPDTKFDLAHPAIFELPPLPSRAGLMPVLRARIVVISAPGSEAGFEYNTGVIFNGTPLQYGMPRGQGRLLLRPFGFKLLSNGQRYGAFTKDYLATMFAANANIGDAMTSDGMGATFTLDISDVARGVDGNTLELRSKLAAKEGTDIGIAKAVDIEVGYLPLAVRDVPTILMPQRAIPKLSVTRGAVRLEVSNRGGFAVDFNHQRLIVETNLGLSDTPHDEMVAEDRPAADALVPNVTVKKADDGFDVMASWLNGRWAGITLKRQLRLTADGNIYWRENWSNSAAHDVVVPFNHLFYIESASGKDGAIARPLLGGNPESEFDIGNSFNPTVFWGDASTGSAGPTGFGWVAEDDWLRNLMRLQRDGKSAQVASRNLALAPGKSIDFIMTLQTQKSASYWDFINAVRARWKVNNVRIDRAITWGGSPEKANLAGAPAQVIGPWLGLGFDKEAALALDQKYGDKPIPDSVLTEFYSFKHREPIWDSLRATAAKMRKESPGSTVWAMMHSSMEVAYAPRLELFPFHGEEIIDANGNPFTDPGYSRAWLGDAPAHGWEVVYVAPTANSKYRAELAHRIDEAFEKANMDGIYSDEFSFAHAALGYSRYDYRQWDGYTVVLDDKGNIQAKVTDNALATLPNQLSMIAAAKRHGKPMLVNTAPATRAVQDAGIYHFGEGGNGFWEGAEMHLTTPLALGNVDQPKTAADLFAISRNLLSTGVLQVPDGNDNPVLQEKNNFIVEQFPITPREIGPGSVSGPERIITIIDGLFHLDPAITSYRLWRYDKDGKLLNTTPPTENVSAGQHILKLKVPESGMTIAELIGK
jgi:hypothetical protein